MVFLKPVNKKENKDGIGVALKTDIARCLRRSWVVTEIGIDYGLNTFV